MQAGSKGVKGQGCPDTAFCRGSWCRPGCASPLERKYILSFLFFGIMEENMLYLGGRKNYEVKYVDDCQPAECFGP